MLNFDWYKFSELTVEQLYAVLILRSDIFVVEQHCPYLDPDGKDIFAMHLLGMEKNSLMAYIRLFPPTDIENYIAGLKNQDLLASAPQITSSDVSILQNNDPATVKDYFNKLFAAYSDTVNKPTKDDLTILKEAFDKNDFSLLLQLDEAIQEFRDGIDAAKKIPAPSDYVPFIVQELNYFSKIKRAIEIFRRADTDPLATVVTLTPRIELIKNIAALHKETGALAKDNGIIFSKDEGGGKLFPQ